MLGPGRYSLRIAVRCHLPPWRTPGEVSLRGSRQKPPSNSFVGRGMFGRHACTPCPHTAPQPHPTPYTRHPLIQRDPLKHAHSTCIPRRLRGKGVGVRTVRPQGEGRESEVGSGARSNGRKRQHGHRISEHIVASNTPLIRVTAPGEAHDVRPRTGRRAAADWDRPPTREKGGKPSAPHAAIRPGAQSGSVLAAPPPRCGRRCGRTNTHTQVCRAGNQGRSTREKTESILDGEVLGGVGGGGRVLGEGGLGGENGGFWDAHSHRLGHRADPQNSYTSALPSSPAATIRPSMTPMHRTAAIPAPTAHTGRPANTSWTMSAPSPPPDSASEPAVVSV
jgi:hypothetical protein